MLVTYSFSSSHALQRRGMTLLDYTLYSVSIAATLFSILAVVSVVVGYTLLLRIHRLLDQFEMVGQTGLETSRMVRDFVEKSTQNVSTFLSTFLSLQGAKEIIGYVGETMKKKKKEKTHE